METAIAKQYLALGNIPILAWTLALFEKCGSVDAVVIAIPETDREYVVREIIERYGFSKVVQVRPGGRMRQDSVRSALQAVDEKTEFVIIHDGVRPFISTDLIDDSITMARHCGAVITAVPVTDTIKRVNGNSVVRESLKREELWSVQTPQVFRREIIKKAYDLAYKDAFYGTDDAMLVERLGIEVKVIMGAYDNIKVTTREDLLMAERIIEKLGIRSS